MEYWLAMTSTIDASVCAWTPTYDETRKASWSSGVIAATSVMWRSALSGPIEGSEGLLQESDEHILELLALYEGGAV